MKDDEFVQSVRSPIVRGKDNARAAAAVSMGSRDDDDAFLLQKDTLVLGAGMLVEPGVVGQREAPLVA